MLACLGFNVPNIEPDGTDYPEVSPEIILQHGVTDVFLSSEPYEFTDKESGSLSEAFGNLTATPPKNSFHRRRGFDLDGLENRRSVATTRRTPQPCPPRVTKAAKRRLQITPKRGDEACAEHPWCWPWSRPCFWPGVWRWKRCGHHGRGRTLVRHLRPNRRPTTRSGAHVLHRRPGTNATTNTTWAVFDASYGGNCCEHYLATDIDGQILNIGGEYPVFSTDRGHARTPTFRLHCPTTSAEPSFRPTPDRKVWGRAASFKPPTGTSFPCRGSRTSEAT